MTRDELVARIERQIEQERHNASAALGKAEALEAVINAVRNLEPDAPVEEGEVEEPTP